MFRCKFIALKTVALILFTLVTGALLPQAAAQNRATPVPDWDKLVEAARKEGGVTIAIPASVELRKQLEENFKKRFGIEVEVFTSRAKGRAAVMIGLTYYSFLPFIKAGLPIKPLPTFREGTYGTGGSGSRRRSLRRHSCASQ